MTKENIIFENNLLTCKSYINKFSSEFYDEIDSKAADIDLNSKINDLFDGKQVNCTENLGAWHPKYRSTYKSDNSNEKYIDIFQSATNVVSIGIGGSFEGPKLLIECAGNTTKNYVFITGSDIQEFSEKINDLDKKETIFVVSSKSFKTDETIQILQNAIHWSGNINKFIAITSNKPEAQKYDIENIIEFDKEIGGRYSIWSDISLVAEWENKTELKDSFMSGGLKADRDLRNNEEYYKFVKRLSYCDIWLNNSKNTESRAVLSYIWKFRSLPNYIQQLEMESLGKKPRNETEFQKTGQIIFGGYGPRAQHSYFQLLHQGTQNICADIIACQKDSKSLAYAQAITQSQLLSNGVNDIFLDEERINGNIPLNLFLVNDEDAKTLGYLIATWEHRTYITAALLGINPYDQFGVNAGKFYTKKYLSDI